VLTSATAARAADVSGPAVSMPLPTPTVQTAPVEDSSGWYLRGDAGYRFNRLGGVSNLAPVPTFNDKLDNSWMFGLGAGYKAQWFRADLTFDYGTQAKYAGSTAAQASDFTARINGFTTLVNFYADLGTWSCFTPYLGLGGGGAYLRTSDFSRASLPSITPVADSSKWNFAWAWMAGVSYQVSQNYLIDFGYRHVNFGTAATGIDSFGNQLTFRNLSADEIRAGMRWSL
jgi:opacity protein-like surface antigen